MSHCTNYSNEKSSWEIIEEAIIKSIKESTTDIITKKMRDYFAAQHLDKPELYHLYDSVCFRSNQAFSTNDRLKDRHRIVEYGQKIIQNEFC